MEKEKLDQFCVQYIMDFGLFLQLNPDSAKGYKSRGIARAMLGQWEAAAKDLHVASKLDYDEEISAVLKKVASCDISHNIYVIKL